MTTDRQIRAISSTPTSPAKCYWKTTNLSYNATSCSPGSGRGSTGIRAKNSTASELRNQIRESGHATSLVHGHPVMKTSGEPNQLARRCFPDGRWRCIAFFFGAPPRRFLGFAFRLPEGRLLRPCVIGSALMRESGSYPGMIS